MGEKRGFRVFLTLKAHESLILTACSLRSGDRPFNPSAHITLQINDLTLLSRNNFRLT